VKPIVAMRPRRYALRSMLNDRSSILSLLETRRSGKPRELIGPGPSPEEMDRILTIAARVPDHGKLTPWQFVRVGNDQREALAQLLRRALAEEDPRATSAHHQAEEEFAYYAGQLVVLVSAPVANHKIPVWEQRLSCGNAGMNLLLAAHALGYVAGWVTGWRAYSPMVNAAFCAPGERIAGFIFIGRPGREMEERPRPALAEVVRRWFLPGAKILPETGRWTATRSGVVEGAYPSAASTVGPLHRPAAPAGSPPRSGED
jgi:nitroreductase